MVTCQKAETVSIILNAWIRKATPQDCVVSMYPNLKTIAGVTLRNWDMVSMTETHPVPILVSLKSVKKRSFSSPLTGNYKAAVDLISGILYMMSV